MTWYQLQRPAQGRRLAADGQRALALRLGFLLPMYTITGFDASAHTAEETSAPRTMCRGPSSARSSSRASSAGSCSPR